MCKATSPFSLCLQVRKHKLKRIIILQVLGSHNFHLLVYHVIQGNQVIVQGKNRKTVESIQKCLKVLGIFSFNSCVKIRNLFCWNNVFLSCCFMGKNKCCHISRDKTSKAWLTGELTDWLSDYHNDVWSDPPTDCLVGQLDLVCCLRNCGSETQEPAFIKRFNSIYRHWRLKILTVRAFTLCLYLTNVKC